MLTCKPFSGAEKYPFIHFNAFEEYPEEKREYQGCPTIAVTPQGRLFAGLYTGGQMEPCILNANILFYSDDHGETWSKPILTIAADTLHYVRNIDIQLWMNPNGELWVFYTQAPYKKDDVPSSIIHLETVCDWSQYYPTCTVMVCKKPDDDVLEWEEPRIFVTGFMRSKLFVSTLGRLFIPAYRYESTDYFQVFVSDNGGTTYRTIRIPGKPAANCFDEGMITEYQHRLRFVARTNQGCYYTSFSEDDGETWSEAIPWEKAPSTRFYLGLLSDNTSIYVRNISRGEDRTGMEVYLSKDGADTFYAHLILDEDENVSYPDVCQDEEGWIYIIHDCERDNRNHIDLATLTSGAAKEIRLSRLRKEDIETGTLSAGAFLKKVISKGGENRVFEVPLR